MNFSIAENKYTAYIQQWNEAEVNSELLCKISARNVIFTDSLSGWFRQAELAILKHAFLFQLKNVGE